MTTWWRRIVAALRMGALWGVAWLGAGMALLLVGLVFGVTADVPFPLLFGLLGFFAGTVFSGVLGLLERGRSFDQMSLPRFAAWGGVGGMLLAGAFVSIVALAGDTTPLRTLDVLLPVFGLAGAGSAAGVLALARKAQEADLLEGGSDLDELEPPSN